MTRVVVDTNVAVVANGRAAQASPDCVERCVDALLRVREHCVVVVDHSGHVFSEYADNLRRGGEPGVGDAFFKWLWDHQGYAAHCAILDIEPLDESGLCFARFPDDAALAKLDPGDRKFVALSLAAGNCPILNAVDSDWWEQEEALRRHGVSIDHPCPDAAPRKHGRRR